jgi:transketolase
MPSWELFERQDEDYRRSVLPPELRPRLAVEAASPMGWCRWVGESGAVIGIERFGASAPGATVLAEYGFTPQRVAERALELLR